MRQLMLAPRCRSLLLLGGLVAALVIPSPAMADEPTPAGQAEAATKRAAELKDAGDKAMDSLNYADALDAYQAAYKLSPSPALEYNLGRVYQALNRYPEALARIEAFKAGATPELRNLVPDLERLLGELRARVSTLEIVCNVPGARVLVDNTVVGATPLPERLRLNAGRRTVDVQAEGYFAFHQTLDLHGAQVHSVQVTLLRSTNGILVVDASSPGADVTIDGKRVGIVPAEQEVAAGTHTLFLRHPQFSDTTASVVVEAGQRKVVKVPLQGKPVTSKWWFWTSLGAAAATIAVVTVAGVSTRSPDTGTIAPGRIIAQGAVPRFALSF